MSSPARIPAGRGRTHVGRSHSSPPALIGVGVDGSASGRDAVVLASLIASATSGELMLIAVYEEPLLEGVVPAQMGWRTAKKQARAMLASTRDSLAPSARLVVEPNLFVWRGLQRVVRREHRDRRSIVDRCANRELCSRGERDGTRQFERRPGFRRILEADADPLEPPLAAARHGPGRDRERTLQRCPTASAHRAQGSRAHLWRGGPIPRQAGRGAHGEPRAAAPATRTGRARPPPEGWARVSLESPPASPEPASARPASPSVQAQHPRGAVLRRRQSASALRWSRSR